MRVALAQIDPTIGDVAGNAALLVDAVQRAAADGAELVVTSELAVLGYPPRDLLLREGVVADCEAAVQRVAEAAGRCDPAMAVVIGSPRLDPDGVRPIRNSAAVCRGGRVEAWYDKRLLPGYDVFDEDRHFEPGDAVGLFEIAGRRVGVLICEDLWRAADVETALRYRLDPVDESVRANADLLVALHATPFVLGKFDRHVRQLGDLARRYRVPLVSVNQVGANDDLIFDGRSLLVRPDGDLAARLPGFEPAVVTVGVDEKAPPAPGPTDAMDELYHALVLGVRDYLGKTGHGRALVGISGGIDSALTAVIAAAAIGAGNVTGVFMPSRHSAAISREDAQALAAALGMDEPREISIDEAYGGVRELLADHVTGGVAGVTDENVQARLRGLLLMALSNAGHGLLLATSNKSELATGYSTLYGDMCGALSVIGDVLKTEVFALSRWINEHHGRLGFARPPVPARTITRPPSAELRPDQTDQDTLPPYEVLDEMIRRYVDHEQSVATIVDESGIDPVLARDLARMIDRVEYKRHQAAVVLKVSPRAFGRGRPMPIVMKQ
ncbi:MAG: NAD+ synthase, partial [Planctomycetota bacterium]